MKLRGLNLTFPICDWRPFLDPESRVRFISPLIAQRGRDYIKGFGIAEERKKLRVLWRAAETVFFHCPGAISLPSHLPDSAPVTLVNRRVYLDHWALVRFEFAIFSNPQHPYPESHDRLSEYARAFWESEVYIKYSGKKSRETFTSALPKLLNKFAEMTSTPGYARLDLCQELEPQLQVIAEATPTELDSEAKSVDNEGKIFMSLHSLRVEHKAASVDTAYLTYAPGYYTHPRGPQFDKFRTIRAHIAWLHADLEILMHILRRCILGDIDSVIVADYLIELTEGLRAAQSQDYAYNKIMGALVEFYEERLSRLLAALKKSKLSESVKNKLVALIERPVSRDEEIGKWAVAKDEGKDTGPESSFIITIVNLVEDKLRKVIRELPKSEKQIQDALETLFIGADIKYSREAVSIEYSSKTYKPDFTIEKLDLAIEVKFCARDARERQMIAEINDDILAYQTKYGNLFFVVYDVGQIRDSDKFAGSFEAHKNVIVRVVKH